MQKQKQSGHRLVARPGADRRNYFTIVELLIVISVIAILAAILLPALQAARKKAQESSCSSNLKQVGVAVAMYLGDNDDYYMAEEDDFVKEMGLLAVYFDSKDPDGNHCVAWNKGGYYHCAAKVLLCPSVPYAPLPSTAPSTERWYNKHYAVNYAFGGRCRTADSYSKTYYRKYARTTSLRGQRLIFMTDGEGKQLNVNSIYNNILTNRNGFMIRYRHGGGDKYGHGGNAFNALWSDGSVASIGVVTNSDMFYRN